MVSHRRSEEAIGPLLGEPARAGKDHWHLGVADSKPAEHVRQPRSTGRLSPEEIGVVTLDHNRRPGYLGQALRLKSQAAVGERGSQVLQRLPFDYATTASPTTAA